MKKGQIILGVIIFLVIFTLFSYLFYKTWVVFGFWSLVWTGLVTTLSGTILGQLIGSRVESHGKIIYNPKEWPKFINIIICESGKFEISKIIKIEGGKNLTLFFNDETTHIIALSQMNFNSIDLISLTKDINSRLKKM